MQSWKWIPSHSKKPAGRELQGWLTTVTRVSPKPTVCASQPGYRGPQLLPQWGGKAALVLGITGTFSHSRKGVPHPCVLFVSMRKPLPASFLGYPFSWLSSQNEVRCSPWTHCWPGLQTTHLVQKLLLWAQRHRKGESEFQSSLVLPAWMILGKVSRCLMQENEDLRF